MKKVLIIEDDLPYQKVYKRKFEVEGFEVEIAEDGELGLEKMRSFRPDVVLLDIMMPKMDGFQVLDHAKADPALNHIPVLITTNLSTNIDSQKLLQKGAAAVIVKSDNEPSVIVERVRAILKEPKAA